MARVELDSTGTTAQWLVSRFRRYFFVLLALLGILIASMAFVPVFLKFAAGTSPIALSSSMTNSLPLNNLLALQHTVSIEVRAN
jgi:hypothetical protein